MKAKLIALAALVASAAFGGPLDKAWIKGTTDKDPLTYKAGETMVFTLTPQGLDGELEAGAYFLRWKRTGDDGLTESGKVAFTQAPFVYKTSIAKPGFVRLLAEVVNAKGRLVLKQTKTSGKNPDGQVAANRHERKPKKVFFDGGAAVQPETLAGVPEPADFDAFWKGQKEKLAAVPFKDSAEVKEVRKTKSCTVYQVKIPCAGPRPVTGHLTVPRAAEQGRKFPARITFDGYGGDISRWEKAPHDGPADEIRLHINAHGYELGKDSDYYSQFAKSIRAGNRSYALAASEHQQPTGCYFEGMTFRVMRGLEYLKSRPEWNGKDLIASGGSQGGLQTAWAAGLDPQVTRANPSVPWCCDMGGNATLGRNPKMWGVDWTPAMGYYDPVNMAKRVPKTCFVEIPRAGLGDYTCPPSGVAVYYNNLTCPKKIHWMQGSEHGYQPPDYEGRDFVREAN